MSFMSHRPDIKMGQFLKSLWAFQSLVEVGTKLCTCRFISGCYGSNVVFVRDCFTIFSLVVEEVESCEVDTWLVYFNDR